MKFWKSFKSGGSAGDPNEANSSNNNHGGVRKFGKQQQQRNGKYHNGSTKNGLVKRLSGRSNGASHDDDPIYEDFCRQSPSPSAASNSSIHSVGPNSFGTTFVELIKRPGTKLGVTVMGSLSETGSEPRIASLTTGSWAQRSDVLCAGDVVVGVNGADAAAMTEAQLAGTIDAADRVQLEVRYPLPPFPPSRLRYSSKVIQVRLRKENGSFGMVIRGGAHEIHRRRRPFTVVYVTEGGAAYRDGVIRVNDRIRTINGVQLQNLKLPELQSLLYRQDGETVFDVEYDVAVHDALDRGPVLVEIRRDDVGGGGGGEDAVVGVGLNKCADSGHVFVESVKQASLADRCGAVHVGDILLSVNGRPVGNLSTDEVNALVVSASSGFCGADNGDEDRSRRSWSSRGTSITIGAGGGVLQMEILPGIFSRNQSANVVRSSMPPSPSFASLRSHNNRTNNNNNNVPNGRRCQRHNSLTDIDRNSLGSSNGLGVMGNSQTLGRRPIAAATANNSITATKDARRRKYVTFTVELQRDGGPLGLTLATDSDAGSPGPIFISALMQDGLAERTRTVQVHDQLVEVNGREVKDLCLNEVIPMLQECSNEIIKLKLARLIDIPERDATLRRHHSYRESQSSQPSEAPSSSSLYYSQFAYSPRKPPLPSPAPSARLPLQHMTPSTQRASNGVIPRRDSSASSAAGGHPHHPSYSPTPTNTVSLLPGNGNGQFQRPVPMEVHRVTLFKDKVYEDFGFSVSDGLYERGIFVNRIRKAGPADVSGLLRPLDRILQINDTRTSDFDCCLAVPLIAAAGDQIDLLVARTNKVFLLARNSAGSLDNYSETSGSLINGADASTYGTMKRNSSRLQQHQQQQQQHPQTPQTATVGRRRSGQRLSRTNSADGRLTDLMNDLGGGGGSLTWEVAPWANNAASPSPAGTSTPAVGRRSNNNVMHDGDEAL